MAAAANLEQAAKQAWDNLAPFCTLGTLRAKLLAFCTAISPSFEQQSPGNHPTANWIAVLWAFAQTMDATAGYWPDLRPAADYVYRLCFMTSQAASQNLISPAQATVVLNAYNTQF